MCFLVCFVFCFVLWFVFFHPDAEVETGATNKQKPAPCGWLAAFAYLLSNPHLALLLLSVYCAGLALSTTLLKLPCQGASR